MKISVFRMDGGRISLSLRSWLSVEIHKKVKILLIVLSSMSRAGVGFGLDTIM